MRKAFERIEAIDKKFNALNPSSPLHDFNEKGVVISDNDIVALADRAFALSRETGGAFDPAIYPLVKLWGFTGDNPSLPEKTEIIKALLLAGREKILIKNGSLNKLQKGAGVDLGGIAAGYAADEALKVLKDSGIKSALIDTGGELYALGKNNGNKWRIGIKNPRGDGIVGIIEAENEAISTSGDYEKYFLDNGKRYHHILDPVSGYPAAGLQSVTIICPNTTEADVWSTAFFVMGKEKGFQTLDKKPGFKVFVITDEGKFFMSEGLKKQFTPAYPPKK